jgi:hypothetical protein
MVTTAWSVGLDMHVPLAVVAAAVEATAAVVSGHASKVTTRVFGLLRFSTVEHHTATRSPLIVTSDA